MPEPLAIRAASTVVLWRSSDTGHQVLMGQRGAGAAFMPSKYVFPGGAVDPQDAVAPLPMSDLCAARLMQWPLPNSPDAAAFAAAALRELNEETGLHLPASEAPILRYFFRAITPLGRPRRFDARFFLADARHVIGDLDNFDGAQDELAHLHWIDLAKARSLDLPFITEVVLAEVTALLAGEPDKGVPFFDNSSDTPIFRRIA